jgi:hypothetical protein
LGQRLPVDQLHDEEDAVAVDAGVVEPRQAGVAQADQGGQLGLVLRAVSGGQRDLVQLDRHVPAGVPVERAVHGGRTAPAEHVTEFVALADAVPGHDLLHGATSSVPTPNPFLGGSRDSETHPGRSVAVTRRFGPEETAGRCRRGRPLSRSQDQPAAIELEHR